MRLVEVDALSPEAVEEPHALYPLPREESPVHWDPKLELFLISRCKDVRQVRLGAKTARNGG